MKNVSMVERVRRLSSQASVRSSLDVYLLATALLLLSTSYHAPIYTIAFLPSLFYVFYAHKAPTTFTRLTVPLQLVALVGWALGLRPLVSLLALQLPATLVALALLPLPRLPSGPTITMVLDASAPHSGSPLALLASWRGHVAWCALARREGKSVTELERSVKEDTEFSWGLDHLSEEEKREMKKEPKMGEVLRSWNRVMPWDRDCVPLGVLER